MGESRELLRRAAIALRDPGCVLDRKVAHALADLLNVEAQLYAPNLAAFSVARAIVREPDQGGEAARVAPPNDLSNWRVRHPGIGVLTYPDETSARVAAGTAGVVYPPGEPHRTDTS